MNPGAVRYIWRDHPGEGTIPQIVVLSRTVDPVQRTTSAVSLHVVRTVIARFVVLLRLGLGLGVSVGALVHLAEAQTSSGSVRADTVRGRVVDARHHGIAGVDVRVSRIGDTTVRLAKSDSSGAFDVLMADAGGDGRLFVDLSSPGLRSRRISPSVSQGVAFVGEVTMVSATEGLRTIYVIASRRRPTKPGDISPDVGGVELGRSGIGSNLLPASGQDALVNAALLMPETALSPDGGLSAFGLPGSASTITLDGISVGGALAVPRDARLAIKVSTSTYDVARGGFSGAQLSVSTVPGDNIVRKSIRGTIEGAPSAANGSGVATTASSRPTSLDLSGSLSGHLLLDKLFYSISVEGAHSASPVSGFGLKDWSALTSRGVPTDSAAVAVALLGQAGLLGGVPLQAERNRLVGLGRFDYVVDSTTRLNLVVNGSGDRQGPIAGSVFTSRAYGGHRSATQTGVTLNETTYRGQFLNEASIAVSGAADRRHAYDRLPTAVLRVPLQSGATADIVAGAETGVLGGRTALRYEANEGLWWSSASKAHLVHGGIGVHGVADHRDPTLNDLGTFTFESLQAFEAGQPDVYTRMSATPETKALSRNASAYISDRWIPIKRLNFQAGVRGDWNELVARGVSANIPAVRDAFGTAGTDRVSGFDLSPRFGARWDIVPVRGSNLTMITLRGGAGRFVGDLSTNDGIVAAAPLTGDDAAWHLTCTGASAPEPAWESYQGGAPPPSVCRDQTGPTTTYISGAVLDQRYRPASSWRGNLGVDLHIGDPWFVGGNVVWSATDRLPRTLDLNLSPVPAFTLADGRPVYTTPARLQSSAGFSVVPTELLVPEYGSVLLLSSGGRTWSRQLSGTVKYWVPSGIVAQLSYARTIASDELNGFDASTPGDPRALTHAVSANSPGTVWTGALFIPSRRWGSLSIVGRLESGRRFTPLFAGDANGDGRWNDQALVPRTEQLSSMDAASLEQLLAAAPRNIRDCVQRNVGLIAARNSCRGPWSSMLDASYRVGGGAFGLPSRVSLQLDLTDIPAGIDLALHGRTRAHGWGRAVSPDPYLLTISGFDTVTRRFDTHINPNFGSVRGTAARWSSLGVRIGASISLTSDARRQQIEIDRRREQRPSAEELLERYVAPYPNPAADILEAADSVGLTVPQRDSLTVLARFFDSQIRAVWLPVARYVAEYPDNPDRAVSRLEAARTPAAINYELAADEAAELLTRQQMSRLPWWVRYELDKSALVRMGLEPR